MSDLKSTVLGLNISLSILATIVVLMRFHGRRLSSAGLGIDDYLVLGALFFSICFAVDSILAVYLGNLGGHFALDPDSNPPIFDQLVVLQKLIVAAQLLSVPAQGLSKLSVLFFYKRIFRGKYFDTIVQIMIVIVILWTIGFILTNFFFCIPFQKYWDGKTGDCTNSVVVFAAITATDVFTDVVILTIPIPQIWKLQLPTSRKVQLDVIFLLGSFVVFTGIARCILPTAGIAGRAEDYSYELAPTVYWTVTEACVGVISACLPTLRPLFTHYGRGNNSGASYKQRQWLPSWKLWRSNISTSPHDSSGVRNKL